MRTIQTTALAIFAIASLVACNSTTKTGVEQDDQFPRITANLEKITIEDFLSLGFKMAKDYDVGGLTAAESAMYGFWKPFGDESVDYEIRFYASHDDATENGIHFADEVTGENALLSDKDVTWKEGTRDRRTSGFTQNGGGGSLAPKYADYIIYANVIVLCQGRDKNQSLERCGAIIKALK